MARAQMMTTTSLISRILGARAPLFFDHAYLELSLLLDVRENVTHQRWNRLCQTLAELENTGDAIERRRYR